MRKIIAATLTSAFLSACGSSSTTSSSGPQRPTGALSGTVGGHAFAATEVQALAAGSGGAACTLPGIGSLGVKAVEIAMTTSTGACADLTSTQCRFHPGQRKVTLLLAKVNPVSPYGEPALTPGTYQVAASITGAVPSSTPGQLDLAYAEALAVPDPDPSCVGSASPSTGGTVWLDQTSGPVTGAVTITFADGSAVSGTFSAPLCGGAPNVCTLALGGEVCSMPAACP